MVSTSGLLSTPWRGWIPGWSHSLGCEGLSAIRYLLWLFPVPTFFTFSALEKQVILKISCSYVSGMHWKLSNIFSALKFIFRLALSLAIQSFCSPMASGEPFQVIRGTLGVTLGYDCIVHLGSGESLF